MGVVQIIIALCGVFVQQQLSSQFADGPFRGIVWEEMQDTFASIIVTPTAPAAIHTRPITRARARQLNYQVLSFLGNDANVHENMMLPKLDTFVLLTNEGLAWTRKMNLGTSSSVEMMACARGSRTELQVMISGL